jgi:hypothetical protein
MAGSSGIATPPAAAMLLDTDVDYLDEDAITPNGQRFALVSFVGPDCRQKNENFEKKIENVIFFFFFGDSYFF